MSATAGPMHATLRRLAADCVAVVFDLEGVLRHFAPDTTQAVAAAVGMTHEGFLRLAFDPAVVTDAVIGKSTFASWCRRVEGDLLERGVDPGVAAEAVRRWVADRGAPVPATVELAAELEAGGRAVFVFTNGTDNVLAELRQIGLGHLTDVVLNSADFGVAKPDPASYAAAHAAIEDRLGSRVAREAVLFTDDRPQNVAGATEFGWRAVVFDDASVRSIGPRVRGPVGPQPSSSGPV